MAEPRRSLLDFAIAASAAVVPVMLGMLLLVAVVRPADLDGAPAWRSGDDRYVSARHLAALKTFERAILPRTAALAVAPSAADVVAGLPACRRDWDVAWRERWIARWRGAPSPVPPAAHIADQLARIDAALLRLADDDSLRLEHRPGLDLARWFDAARGVLGSDAESPDYPGQRFRIGCADLAGAVAALARADGRMLRALAWRGLAAPSLVARWDAQQQVAIGARDVMRRNPWSGVAGCVYLRPAVDGADGAPPLAFIATRSAQARLCARPELARAQPTPPELAGAQRARSDLADAQPARPELAAVKAAPPDPAAVQRARLGGAAGQRSRAVRALPGEPGPATPADDPRWSVPPSLATLLQPLEALRQPSASLYHALADADAPGAGARGAAGGSNRIVVDGAPTDVGFSIDLTIDADTQALAQKTAACYTGRHEVCSAVGLGHRDEPGRPLGDALLEGAMVRMAAVAIVDVASGRIDALAGALSRCARLDAEGRPRDAACDARLPRPARVRPDALLNPAVFHDAMPASTIKPILATAFLADREVGPRWLADERAAMQRPGVPARESLRGQLLRSDSARFLDRLFCSDKGYAACARPWAAQATAASFGWNLGCADARLDCGKQDLLFGRAVEAPAAFGGAASPTLPIAYGRLLTEPSAPRLGAPMRLRAPLRFDSAALRRCANGVDGRRYTDDDWERCRGAALVDVVAEGWGQGHARATALGVAGMMATLAAAANGQTQVRRPHLVEAVRGTPAFGATPAGATLARWNAGATEPVRVPHDAAEAILDGLSYSHRAGTARSACEQVFDAARCQRFDWLAGKTGTPSFPGDGLALDALEQLCRAPAAAAPLRPGLCGSLRPYKWYVAAYRGDGASSGPWTKVIAVLTERNWVRRSGRIHGAGDHGPNPSAEIAMQVAGRRAGLIAASAP